MQISRSNLIRYGAVLVAAAAILVVYLSTLQTIPNGSSHPYMIDVGETQVALNVWGTLHATGYPLYTVLGNFFTPLIRLFGVNPAAAASLFSLLWTLIALGGLYLLLNHLTGKPHPKSFSINGEGLIAALSILVLALTRSVWIHSVIAEVYSMSLAILIGLWLLAIWETGWSLERRVQALALLGGIGVAHHRTIALVAPALFFALWPQLRANYRQLPRILLTSIPLALLGFLQYLYLPIAAQTGSKWVYGNVGTWDGFWFTFWGHEADYLITRPSTLQGWIENLEGTLEILKREITMPGIVIAIIALILANWKSPHRYVAWMTTLSGLGFFAFAVAYHKAVLPEAVLMMALPSIVVAVALTVDWLWRQDFRLGWAGAIGMLIWAIALYPHQHAFIEELTTDPTGVNIVESVSQIPRIASEEPVLMIPWSTRYFAASYSRLVTGENRDLQMVDHNADFAELVAANKTFYTVPETFYGNYSTEWWENLLGDIYLTSGAPGIVQIGTEPRLEEQPTEQMTKEVTAGIWIASYDVTCTDEKITLAVNWYAAEQPDRNLSVFVHLTPADVPFPLEQADTSNPVYGWRPTSTWLAGELILDHYQLPRLPDGKRMIFGMWEGESRYGETEFNVDEMCG